MCSPLVSCFIFFFFMLKCQTKKNRSDGGFLAALYTEKKMSMRNYMRAKDQHGSAFATTDLAE